MGVPPPQDPSFGPRPQVRFEVIGQAWLLLRPSLDVWIPAILIAFVIEGVLQYALQRISVFGSIISSIAGYYFGGGLMRMAVRQVQGEKITVGDVFGASDVLGALIVAGVLTGLGTVVGCLFCIIPGLILAALWMFTLPLIVDRRMGSLDAMSLSMNTLKGELASATLFYFVLGLVAVAGILACGVGILITAPLSLLAIARLYCDYFPRTAEA